MRLPDVWAGAPEKWQMAFQTPGTEVMEKLVDLHHDVAFFLITIVFFVGWMLATILDLYSSADRRTVRVAFSHQATVEQV